MSVDLTSERTELKYVLPRADVPRLKDTLGQKLSVHHHEARSSRVAAMAQHYTTTVYFDTRGRELYQAARGGDDHLKLRAREYYDVLPLAELATDASELLRHRPILWLELKLRAGNRSGKRRIGVPKRRLMGFLADREVDDELRDIQRQAYGEGGDALLDELLEFLGSFAEPLSPSCVANYRRTSWQDDSARLRVTLDEDLAFYAPTPELWAREAALTREVLGQAAAVERRVVLEVKHHGPPPQWLQDALARTAAQRCHYSKFVSSVEAVHSG